MRIVTLGLASGLLVLALTTAAWRSEAAAVAAQNQQTESDLARLRRVRDRVNADVEGLKQPLVVRARREGLAGDGLLLGSLSSTLRSEMAPLGPPAKGAVAAAKPAVKQDAVAKAAATPKANKNPKGVSVKAELARRNKNERGVKARP